MWEAINQVGSALTLIAFLAAVGVALWRRYLLARERQLTATPEADRGATAQALNDAFLIPSLPVDPKTLTPSQQYRLLLEQIRDRSRRFYIVAVVIVVVAILIAIVTVIAGYQAAATGGDPQQVPDTVATGDLRLVDAFAHRDTLDIKVQNRGKGSAFIKALAFSVDQARVGGSTCGPIMPTEVYKLIVDVRGTQEVLQGSPKKETILKLSQLVPPDGADRFTVLFSLPEDRWGLCSDTWLFNIRGRILYDQNGSLELPPVHLEDVVPESIRNRNLALADNPELSGFKPQVKYTYRSDDIRCDGYFLSNSTGEWIEFTPGAEGCIPTLYHFRALASTDSHTLLLNDPGRGYYVRIPGSGGWIELSTSPDSPWSRLHKVSPELPNSGHQADGSQPQPQQSQLRPPPKPKRQPKDDVFSQKIGINEGESSPATLGGRVIISAANANGQTVDIQVAVAGGEDIPYTKVSNNAILRFKVHGKVYKLRVVSVGEGSVNVVVQSQ